MRQTDRELAGLTGLVLSRGGHRPRPTVEFYPSGSASGRLLIFRGGSLQEALKRLQADILHFSSIDSESQAFFRTRGGELGIAVAGSHEVIIILDQEESFLQMIERLRRHDLSCWRRLEFPDGSGSISLPSGWSIATSLQGMVVAVGPEGRVELGRSELVYTPERAALMWVEPPMVAEFTCPRRALGEVQVLEETPLPWPMGQASMFRLDRGEVLVIMSDNSDGTWFLYISAAYATHPADLPILHRIWDSWRVHPWAYRDRIDRFQIPTHLPNYSVAMA